MSEIIASPSVRALAAKSGIDIDRLARHLGRETITRDDIERKLDPPRQDVSAWDIDHSAFGPVTEEPLSRFTRLAAENLTAATRAIPSVTHHDSAEIGMIEAFRERIRPEAEKLGLRLTGLAFQVKALARALREFPRFNASLSPDGAVLVKKHYVSIGIAVDAPHGLTVPVIRNADRKGVFAITTELAGFATRARERKIRPDELGGASMTVSSLGGIGGEAFTPIINPPELAILGISRSVTRPRWNGAEFVPTLTLPLDLTYDHRVINGAEAARFLRYLCSILAAPERILM